jgi:hypothetical protein
MSYDLCLNDPVTGECLQFDEPHHMRGGTYCVGGERWAKLNITWNYGKHYRRVMGEKGYPRALRQDRGGGDSAPRGRGGAARR